MYMPSQARDSRVTFLFEYLYINILPYFTYLKVMCNVIWCVVYYI